MSDDEGLLARSEMTPLQALVVGAIMGSMMRAETDFGLVLEARPVLDDQGYTDSIRVTGKISGESVIVRVTPERPSAVEAGE